MLVRSLFALVAISASFAAEIGAPKEPAPLTAADRAEIWESRARVAELAAEFGRLQDRLAQIQKEFPDQQKALDAKLAKVKVDYKAEGYALDDKLTWKPIKPAAQNGAPVAQPKPTQP